MAGLIRIAAFNKVVLGFLDQRGHLFCFRPLGSEAAAFRSSPKVGVLGKTILIGEPVDAFGFTSVVYCSSMLTVIGAHFGRKLLVLVGVTASFCTG